MEKNEAVVQKTGNKGKRAARGGKKTPLIVVGAILAAVLAAYIGLCVWVTHNQTIWKGTFILGQDLGGMTVDEAVNTVEAALPSLDIGLYLYDGALEYAPDRGDAPDAVISLADLNAQIDVGSLIQGAHDFRVNDGSFLTAGWRYLSSSGLFYGGSQTDITVDTAAAEAAAEAAAAALSLSPQDTTFTADEDHISVRLAQDGRSVSAEKIQEGLERGYWDMDLGLDVPYTIESAQTLTAREIYDEVSAEVKNAGYDAATDTIIPEQVGAEFDVEAAEALISAAAPGEVVEIPATIEYPSVTAEELERVLFRDVLGTATTHVGGTAARISNVKLASAAVNGTVLNSGDVFSYNETTGQRTAAKGYLPAPAYVQGETVDEIGGGVCQPSSTLYLACLNSNLEIVERYAHRYVPSYIAKGMDATVSWGGPDYKFRNDTDYPIKISAVYANGYLTMTIYGTKTDSTYVKMTNKVLSSTPWTTVYQDDETLPAGTEKVSVTPYTGYKVESYRNIYDGDGTLLSSTFEASSNYKVRNQVILRGPSKVDPGTTEPGTTEPGTTEPVTPESGATEPGTTDPNATESNTTPGMIVIEPELGPANSAGGEDGV